MEDYYGVGFIFGLLLILCVPLFITHCIFYLRFKKPFLNVDSGDSKIYYRVFWLITILLFGIFLSIPKFGNKDINSFFCRSEFTLKGYVYAFPNSENDKNYHLKADIHKVGSYYEVKRIYFYNGGYLDLDSYDVEEPLLKNGSMSCGYYDKNENEWCFRFYGDVIKK